MLSESMIWFFALWLYFTAFTTGLVWRSSDPTITWQQRFWVILGMFFFWYVLLVFEIYETYYPDDSAP